MRVMLNGKCHKCLWTFEGSAPDCWCAYCHGHWAAGLYKQGMRLASGLATHWRCPDCERNDCPRASHHGWDCACQAGTCKDRDHWELR